MKSSNEKIIKKNSVSPKPLKKEVVPLTLNNLQPIQKSRKNKRVGRGIGSNRGKTSTAGHKGQRARSGHKIGFAFEGGQMPYYRRIPKARGFRPINKTIFQVVNLFDIAKLQLKEVNHLTLYQSGLIRKKDQPVKILGDGDLEIKTVFLVNAVSKIAKEKILKSKGEIKLI